MSILAFILSLAMLAYVALAVARRWGADPAERFWLAVAAAGLQIGSISLIASIARALTPLTVLGAQLLLVIAAAIALPRPRWSGAGRIRVSKIGLLLAVAFVLLLGSSAIEQLLRPVWDFDDRMYHASRSAFWLQHQSIFAWTTHNDRQIVFPLSGELWFFWPLMLTRSEAVAQLIFWLAYPLAAVGVHLSLRAMGLSRRASALGALLFVATPMVLYHTQVLHPELWLALYSLGAAFWAVRAGQDQTRPLPLIMLGIFAALSISVRPIAAPLAVTVFLVPWLIGRPAPAAMRGMGRVIVGMIAGLLLAGSLGVFVQNVQRDGHPFGSSGMRALHSADLSVRQVRTHGVRLILTLLDVPFAPGESAQAAISHAKIRAAGALGGGEPLPMEDLDWPGPEHYTTQAFAKNYSLAGWIWLPALLWGVALAARDARATWPRVMLRPVALISLLALPTLLACALLIRWMDGMGRFWLGPFAQSLLVIVPLGAHLTSRRCWIKLLLAIGIAAMVMPAIADRLLTFRAAAGVGLPQWYLDEPFGEALAQIPDGSTILLVASADARDYPLFRPRRGFVNRVISWGKQTFDPARMDTVLSSDWPRVTHVLIQDDRMLNLYWDGTLATGAMVQDLSHRRDWVEIPLPHTPHMRLFARKTG